MIRICVWNVGIMTMWICFPCSKKWRVEERDDWKGLVDAIQADRAHLQVRKPLSVYFCRFPLYHGTAFLLLPITCRKKTSLCKRSLQISNSN
jgi:hypothetical protein